MSGMMPYAMNTGVYPYWSIIRPLSQLNSIPPKPEPMLASPQTDATMFFGTTSGGNASALLLQPV